MSRFFLASLRGADARSIAHALALLLVFNGIFGAFHAGAMANGLDGTILCSSEGAVRAGEGLPKGPADPEEISCCVLGSGPSPTATAAEPSTIFGRTFAPEAIATHLVDNFRDPRLAGSASPRGPPALA